ncbi:MAG TPA: DoxX family protein, partial [Hymenobacter sp.]
MKLVTRICWVLLGGLFIFSGLIKLNDPIGTALKLEEYFEVFAEDFGAFFLNF